MAWQLPSLGGLPGAPSQTPYDPSKAFETLGDGIGAISDARDANKSKDALADIPKNPDGSINFGEAASRLFQVGDLKGGSEFGKLAQLQMESTREQANADRDYSLKSLLASQKAIPDPFTVGPGQVRYDGTGNVIAEGPAKPVVQSAADKKATYDAEDQLPIIDSSIDQLTRAMELNKKAFSGYGAGARGALGSKLPDWAVPDSVSDPEAASATSEYQAIMTGEAATAMSAALKGATTDRELGIFMDIIGDVTKPPQVRENAIKRMLALAQKQKKTLSDRVSELRGAAGTSAEAPSVPEAQAAPVASKTVNGVTYEQDANGDWYEVP